MPFTLNFTINNLLYVEDMHRPGSWKFNNTERVLQDLVRAPPTSLLPRPPNTSPTYLTLAPTDASHTHITSARLPTLTLPILPLPPL